MQYRLGELFCGPGGIAWGATHADIGNSDYSIVHQWANDYDASTCETYRRNICPDAPQTVPQIRYEQAGSYRCPSFWLSLQ